VANTPAYCDTACVFYSTYPGPKVALSVVESILFEVNWEIIQS
jgi:hypothetical protein